MSRRATETPAALVGLYRVLDGVLCLETCLVLMFPVFGAATGLSALFPSLAALFLIGSPIVAVSIAVFLHRQAEEYFLEQEAQTSISGE